MSVQTSQNLYVLNVAMDWSSFRNTYFQFGGWCHVCP